MSDEATHAEKVRGTFDELDLRRARSFGLDEWITILQRLRMDLSLSVMRELFDCMDANHDGQVTYGEYTKFAEGYPTLLDSLYYRSKDYWTDVHQLQDLEDALRQERALQEKAEARRAECLEMQRAREAEEAAFEQRVQDAQGLERGLQECGGQLKDVQQRTNACREAAAQARVEEAGMREMEEIGEATVADARQAVEAAIRRAQDIDSEVVREEGVLRDLEARVAEQRKLVSVLVRSGEVCREEVGRAQETERQAVVALDDLRKGMEGVLKQIAAAENELADSINSEMLTADAMERLSQQAADATQALRDQERDLHTLRERERLAEAQEESVREARREQKRITAALDAQNRDFNTQRVHVEREELPLLEQEISLRQQRAALETREAKLRVASAHGLPYMQPLVNTPHALHDPRAALADRSMRYR